MYIGDKEASFEVNEITGKLVEIGNESYYKISNVNDMRPFFMSIVSHSNHWMFISSNGGLSAGRKIVIMHNFRIIRMIKLRNQLKLQEVKHYFKFM